MCHTYNVMEGCETENQDTSFSDQQNIKYNFRQNENAKILTKNIARNFGEKIFLQIIRILN